MAPHVGKDGQVVIGWSIPPLMVPNVGVVPKLWSKLHVDLFVYRGDYPKNE